MNTLKILQQFKTLPLEQKSETFARVCVSLEKIDMPKVYSRCNKPVEFLFHDQLMALLYFHLFGLDSGRELLQNLSEDDFAKTIIAGEKEIKKSTFFDAINRRGLEGLREVFNQLNQQAFSSLPSVYSELRDLVAIGGSLIDALCLCVGRIMARVLKKQRYIWVSQSTVAWREP